MLGFIIDLNGLNQNNKKQKEKKNKNKQTTTTKTQTQKQKKPKETYRKHIDLIFDISFFQSFTFWLQNAKTQSSRQNIIYRN